MQNKTSQPAEETGAPYSAFLQIYDNKKTRENYASALQKYLRHINSKSKTANPKNTKKPDEKTYDTIAKNYLRELKQGKNPAHDLIPFTNTLTKTHAAATVRITIQTVILWLEDNEIRINRQTRKRIAGTIPKTYSVRHETELTRKLFKNIHAQMTKEWAKTLLILLLSTGLRLGEALSLKETDIIRTKTRTKLHIRAETTKTKTERTVILTKEAAETLEHHLAEQKKEKKTKTANKTAEKAEPNKTKTHTANQTTNQKTRSEKEEYLFPYTKAAAERQMRNAADKAGYGKTDSSPRTVHWHMTRKYFITQVTLHANKDIAETLAGHEGYLSKAYRRITARQILAGFKKAEKYLTLFPNTDKQNQKTARVYKPPQKPETDTKNNACA